MWILRRLAACFAIALTGLAAPVYAADAALVTEVSGAVTNRASKPVRALDVMKPGDRLRLPAGARASVFVSDAALLFTLEGPVEIAMGPQGLVAVKGTLPQPTRLHEAYRNLRVNDPSLVQATMIMRTSGEAAVRAISPQGVVTGPGARQFTWKAAGKVHFELATGDGQSIYVAEADGGRISLPASAQLSPGVKYVWGLSHARGGPPLDWTEFIVAAASDAVPQAPDAQDSASRRILHAAWLQQNDLARAAARELQEARLP